MQVAVVGAGYVGLTTGIAFAYLGHQVSILDHNRELLSKLRNGISPIGENGIEDLIRQTWRNLSFVSSLEGLEFPEVMIIAVGTPSKSNGDANLSFLEKAIIEAVNQVCDVKCPLIVIKSTVPPGTANRMKTMANNHASSRGLPVEVTIASNPEFLREGSALSDALYPDRIVLGTADEQSLQLLQELYKPIITQDFQPPGCLPRPVGYQGPVVFSTDSMAAELIKYASNSFLAMKISFINEFAGLCELLGADILDVARGMGLDHRIGDKFLMAGAGWGGSCFGKDTAAIINTARHYDYDLQLVQAAVAVNQGQRKSIIRKLRTALKTMPGSTIGMLGLAFKPGTDDVREAPATDIIKELLNLGAMAKVFDPVATSNHKKNHPELKVQYTNSLDDLAAGCDALLLITEWEMFKVAPWRELRAKMKGNVFVDGRNFLNPRQMQDYGYDYQGVGRVVQRKTGLRE